MGFDLPIKAKSGIKVLRKGTMIGRTEIVIDIGGIRKKLGLQLERQGI